MAGYAWERDGDGGHERLGFTYIENAFEWQGWLEADPVSYQRGINPCLLLPPPPNFFRMIGLLSGRDLYAKASQIRS